MKSYKYSIAVCSLLTGMAVTGCNGKEQASSNSNSKVGQPKELTQEPIRPSEDGEGLPGYFVDPKMVKVDKDGNSLVLNASAGAVLGNDLAAVKIQVFKWTAGKILSRIPALNNRYVVDVNATSMIEIGKDGSFAARIKNDYVSNYILAIGLSQDVKYLIVPETEQAQPTSLVISAVGSLFGVVPFDVGSLSNLSPDIFSKPVTEPIVNFGK